MAITALPTPPTRDDPTNFAERGDTFLAALPTFVTEANALAAAMNLNSTTDASGSSLAIGTGTKTFTVSTGKSFQPGMYLVAADVAAPSTNSMWGQVTSYSGTTLVLEVIAVRGSGTKTSWVISQSAPGGAQAGVNADITQLTALAVVPSIITSAISAAIAALVTVPVGTVLPFTGQVASCPAGYIPVPTGAANISRSTFSALFAVIGTTWGAGDGSTTFGAPYCPPGYTFIHTTTAMGTLSIGEVVSHTHRPTFGGTPSTTTTVYNNSGNSGLGGGASSRTENVLNIEATGGAANKAAGANAVWILKY